MTLVDWVVVVNIAACWAMTVAIIVRRLKP